MSARDLRRGNQESAVADPAAAPRAVRRALMGAALALLTAASVSAHASLVRSNPANRANLVSAPERVQLWFSERLEPAFSRLGVVDAEGQSVDRGDVQVGPDDPTRLSVGIAPLGPGRYTVRFRVLSVDGHVVEGQISFTVRRPSGTAGSRRSARPGGRRHTMKQNFQHR